MSAKKKHTNGRWRAGEVRHAGRYQLVESDAFARGYVCEVQAHEGADLGATVALIAAAPALADALEKALPACGGTNIMGEEINAELCSEIRAALRAAGRPTPRAPSPRRTR